jgi:hypothetical protein
MAVNNVGGPRVAHASSKVPNYVGGETYKTVDAFKNTIGKNGTAVLAPGDKVLLPMPDKNVMGVVAPTITGLNKNSPFSAKTVTKDGKQYLEISVKSDAKIGQKDKVDLNAGPLTANVSKNKFPLTLQVGIGHIMMG